MRRPGRLREGPEVRAGGPGPRLCPCSDVYAAVTSSGFIHYSKQPGPYHISFEGKIELKMEKKQICEPDSQI